MLANRGANGIDGLVSTAFGVAAAATGPVVLLIGDVALAHDIGGLAAAKRLHLPLVIVLLDNDGGGIFDFLPVAREGGAFEEHIATPHGLDFAHAAALYGLRHERVAAPEPFREALDAALARPGATLIHIRTDRAENVAVHDAVWAAVRAAAARELRRQPASTGSSAPSLTSVSASSAAGSESRTTPTPGVQPGLAPAQQRTAQRDTELAVLVGVRPADRARVPAAIEALERGDHRHHGGVGLPAHGGRRVQPAGQLDDGIRLRELRADRRREVLDIGHPHDRGLVRRRHPDTQRAQRARDAAADDRLLLAVLGRLQQLLAEVRVDRGIGGPARRSGERDRRRPQALAPHQQLRRGADERRVAHPAQYTKHDSNPSRSTPNTAAASCGAGAWTATSRASTIFSNAPERIRSTARATASS